MSDEEFRFQDELQRHLQESRKFEQEALRFTGRKLPTFVVAAAVIAFVLALLAVLLLPLIYGASEWREAPIGCAEDAGRRSAFGRVLIGAGDSDFDQHRVFTRGQARSARQAAYVWLTFTDAAGLHRSIRGNAYVYDDGLVITSEHILGDRTTDAVITVFCNGRDVAAKVLRTNDVLDVALLAAPECHGRRLKLSSEPPAENERLIAAGFDFWSSDDPATVRQEFRPELAPGRQFIVATRYSHLRVVDPAVVLRPENVPIYDGMDSDNRESNLKIRRNIEEIQRRGWPRYLAVKGIAEPGQSGSFLLQADGSIAGHYVNRFTHLNRSFYTPAAAIRMVLRGAGDDG